MEKAIITFANGEKLTLAGGQCISPIIRTERDGEIFSTSEVPVYLIPHVHDGLIPSITDLLCACEFFSLNSDLEKVYKVSAVVSIERL